MIITNKKLNKQLPLYLNFDILKRVEKHKVLGVVLDDKLSFRHHIQEICKKVSKGISVLYQLRDNVPEYVLKCLYNTHVLPHILYCSAIWGSTYSTHLQPLFILQKRAIRIINKAPFLETTQPLFKRSKILKLYDQIKLEIATYMFKNKNTEVFQRIINHYNTRQIGNLNLPRHDLTQYENSLAYAGPKLWNSLTNHLKDKITKRSFRLNYKRELLSKY